MLEVKKRNFDFIDCLDIDWLINQFVIWSCERYKG